MISEPKAKCCFEIVKDAPPIFYVVPRKGTFTVTVGMFSRDTNGEGAIMKPRQSVPLETILLYEDLTDVPKKDILKSSCAVVTVGGYADIKLRITENSSNEDAFKNKKASVKHDGRRFVIKIQMSLTQTEFQAIYGDSRELQTNTLHTRPIFISARAKETRVPLSSSIPRPSAGKRVPAMISTVCHEEGHTNKWRKKSRDSNSEVAMSSPAATQYVPLTVAMDVLTGALRLLENINPHAHYHLLTRGHDTLLREAVSVATAVRESRPGPDPALINQPPAQWESSSTIYISADDSLKQEERGCSSMDSYHKGNDVSESSDLNWSQQTSVEGNYFPLENAMGPLASEDWWIPSPDSTQQSGLDVSSDGNSDIFSKMDQSSDGSVQLAATIPPLQSIRFGEVAGHTIAQLGEGHAGLTTCDAFTHNVRPDGETQQYDACCHFSSHRCYCWH